MILACQNISKAFGVEQILKDISFHIEEKEKKYALSGFAREVHFFLRKCTSYGKT